jgi:HPt (histidine-containing phosphotransfer) domain-containing protein
MAQLATQIADRTLAARVIDRDHLARMTFGDRGLEREVLQLFDRQAELLLARMRTGAPQAVATLAHTLRGSAAGIGADRVAAAAEAVEQSADATERDAAMDVLARTIVEARATIAELLRD